MNMANLKSKAKGVGVKPGGLKKAELIRSIQIAEGNEDCFGRKAENCEQMNCCFRSDCLA